MPADTKHEQFGRFESKWTRCRDTYEGSDAVKKAGEKYLPALSSHALSQEGSRAYDAYKERALFFNAMGRTVDGLSGAIFQKSPVFTSSPDVAEHLKDVTMSGVSAEMFGLRSTREVLKIGRFGILVDMAVQGDADVRPYWAPYFGEDIVNWQTLRVGGEEVVVRVMLREKYTEPDPNDQFGVVSKVQYRELLLPGADVRQGVYTVRIWRQSGEGKPFDVLYNEHVPMRRGAPLKSIPFVFLNPTTLSPDVEKPPLLDLADVNLSHYRTSADLEHGRHLVALPTPWVKGVVIDPGQSVEMGSGSVWVLGPEGEAGMLEFSGAGLASLVTADQEKRKLMAVLGARLLEDANTGQETATAVSMRHAGETATLRTIAAVVEEALSIVLRWHQWWLGTEATSPDPMKIDAKCELNKDFFMVRATPDEIKTNLLLAQAGKISFKTFYERLQVGGWAREGVTAEEELKDIDAEEMVAAEKEAAAAPEIPPGGPEGGVPPMMDDQRAGGQPPEKKGPPAPPKGPAKKPAVPPAQE